MFGSESYTGKFFDLGGETVDRETVDLGGETMDLGCEIVDLEDDGFAPTNCRALLTPTLDLGPDL